MKSNLTHAGYLEGIGGFSLAAAQEIAAYGDAVCPDVAQLIFEMIKIYDNE